MTLTTRSATVRPSSANEDARTVEVHFATSNPVRVSHPTLGRAFEILDLSPGAVNLERLTSGNAPVLDGHNRFSAAGIIGRVISARIEGGRALATLQFSRAAEVEPTWQKIADGTIRSVSVGYEVQQHKRDGERDGLPVVRATAWTPVEISIVAIPADAGATIRSGDGPAATPNPPHYEASQMTETTTTADDAGTIAVRAERARVAGLDTVTRAAEPIIGREAASDLRARANAEGWTEGQMRERAFDAAAAAGPVVRGTHAGGQTFDNPTFIRDAMAEALACRAGAGKPSERALEFMPLRIADMAGRLLESKGVSTRGMNATQIITRAHTTSDFPALLLGTGDRVLQTSFMPAASGLRQIMRARTANDFRTLSSVRAAGVDRLNEVPEGGEVTYGTAFEASETYRVKPFARAITLTRQAMINDDLGAFDTMRAIGMAAAVTEAEEFLTLLTANTNAGPTMADGNPLFYAARGNLAASGAAIDVTTVSAGRIALRTQTDLNGVQIANAPRYLLVGPAYETAAEQFVASITAATTGTVNPFSGRLEVVVEPRLTGNSWYLFADPMVTPTFEMATLSATGGTPQTEIFTEASTLGATIRVVHDFGIGAINTVGAWRNPGA